MPTSPPDGTAPTTAQPPKASSAESPAFGLLPPSPTPTGGPLLSSPDLVLLTNLLSRLLAKLEEPSGELDTALAQVLTQLSTLAGTMAQAAQAFETALGPEGVLGRIEAELAAMRDEQAEQRARLDALTAETATLVDWLAAPLEDAADTTRGASEEATT